MQNHSRASPSNWTPATWTARIERDPEEQNADTWDEDAWKRSERPEEVGWRDEEKQWGGWDDGDGWNVQDNSSDLGRDPFQGAVGSGTDGNYTSPYQRRVPIPNNIVGSFVGKGGGAMKQFCARFRCVACIEKGKGCGGKSGCSHILIGCSDGEENLSRALDWIEQRIATILDKMDKNRSRVDLEPWTSAGHELSPDSQRVRIPRHLVGPFLGVRGSAIKEISTRSGTLASIDVKGDESYVVVGQVGDPPENISYGVELVKRRLDDLRAQRLYLGLSMAPNHARSVRIPRRLVGQFVGSNGVAIKEICARANCFACVDDGGGSGTEAEVIIGRASDPMENIEKGVELVKRRIADLQNQRSVHGSGQASEGRRIPIARRIVGQFVGSGGAAIKQICSTTGCGLYVHDEGAEDNDAAVVVGRPTDPPEAIENAARLVEERIAHLSQSSRRIGIPSHLIGMFVGTGGVAIKDIRAKAGCFARVDDKGRKGAEAEVIIGRATDSPESIERGVELVLERIAELCGKKSEGGQKERPSRESAAGGSHERRGARVEVQAEIHMSTSKQDGNILASDFDFKVISFLVQIHERRGRMGVRKALERLQEATLGRSREGVRKYPAYLLTLLRKYEAGFVANAASSGREDSGTAAAAALRRDDDDAQDPADSDGTGFLRAEKFTAAYSGDHVDDLHPGAPSNIPLPRFFVGGAYSPDEDSGFFDAHPRAREVELYQ